MYVLIYYVSLVRTYNIKIFYTTECSVAVYRIVIVVVNCFVLKLMPNVFGSHKKCKQYHRVPDSSKNALLLFIGEWPLKIIFTL